MLIVLNALRVMLRVRQCERGQTSQMVLTRSSCNEVRGWCCRVSQLKELVV
jgi:hypothetical protein